MSLNDLNFVLVIGAEINYIVRNMGPGDKPFIPINKRFKTRITSHAVLRVVLAADRTIRIATNVLILHTAWIDQTGLKASLCKVCVWIGAFASNESAEEDRCD